MSDTKNFNPANAPAKTKVDAGRIPMSLPEQKLSAPDIPGFHPHWFLSGNVQRALRGGYEFVNYDEVDILSDNVANEVTRGNTDLGSRVSRSAGPTPDERGNEQRLYLMKIKQEYWDADQAALGERNESIAQALRGGRLEETPDENRYIPESVRKNVTNLFTPKHNRKA